MSDNPRRSLRRLPVARGRVNATGAVDSLMVWARMVIGEADGERVQQSMVWDFPLRLKGMKPVRPPTASEAATKFAARR
ncbi:MAG: hypothetical protein QOE02_2243 [Rhodospirillaceae bacterium]|nr:hypothetical protein [Rhodospirillaceae bacterium]